MPHRSRSSHIAPQLCEELDGRPGLREFVFVIPGAGCALRLEITRELVPNEVTDHIAEELEARMVAALLPAPTTTPDPNKPPTLTLLRRG